MRTDYAGHERVYQRLRMQADRDGWDDPQQQALVQELLLKILGWPGFPKQGRLLELGCGAGNTCIALAGQGFEVHGIDISDTAIAWARERALKAGTQCTFETGNVLDNTTLSDASFDMVVDGHCLHCIVGTDRQSFFAESWRLLKPQGILLIRSMCNPTPTNRPPGFDEASSCVISATGVASRFIGQSDAILAEIDAGGFHILRHHVEQALSSTDTDELIVMAVKRL